MLRNLTLRLSKVHGCKKLVSTVFVTSHRRLTEKNLFMQRTFSIISCRRNLLDNTTYSQVQEEGSNEAVDIEGIAEGDPETEKLLKVLILEVDIFRQDGQLVPDKIDTDEWRELLTIKSRTSRQRYLTFLFKNERKRDNKLRLKEERRLEKEKINKEEEESGHIKYGFGGNTIFLRIYDSTMDNYLNKNLMNACLFSQHIVIDCSYDSYMTNMEAKNCARQMCILFSDNRNHPQPFHIQFCNVDKESHCIKSLHRYIPPMFDNNYPFFSSPKSYLDMYPREKLVYLTPHCKTDLTEWNHDDVYIIGAMVDKTNPKPLSLAKAKENGLRMAKLPLERYLLWASGAGKCFTLNHMISILLDMRHTGSWETAFRHIPRRKIVQQDELIRENNEKRTTYGKKFTPYGKKTFAQKDVQVSNDLLRKIKPGKVDFSKLYD